MSNEKISEMKEAYIESERENENSEAKKYLQKKIEKW